MARAAAERADLSGLRIAVAGLGAVGRVAARSLATDPAVGEVVALRRPTRSVPTGTDVVVITVPHGVRGWAADALAIGAHVVSVADDTATVRSLLGLGAEAEARGRHVVAGAGMAPGLGCVLAAWLAERFDVVDEVHVASLGTGGPSCARAHHRALSSVGVDYRGGAWRRRPGGSGRELVWFPEPVGGADCYRCDRADAILLAPAFPAARRITARVAATRRDRLTMLLPMFYPPHPEGLVGAVRASVRGWSGGRARTEIVGATARPALAAGVVAATAATWAATGLLGPPGAGGLAASVGQPGAFLRTVAAGGVALAAFEGATALL